MVEGRQIRAVDQVDKKHADDAAQSGRRAVPETVVDASIIQASIFNSFHLDLGLLSMDKVRLVGLFWGGALEDWALACNWQKMDRVIISQEALVFSTYCSCEFQ